MDSEILGWLEKYDCGFSKNQYKILPSGLIDTVGDVRLDEKGLESIPYQFNRVVGYFDCSYNKLKSLYGTPYYVTNTFYCTANDLTNLEYSPLEAVGFEWVNVEHKTLKDLVGMTKYIKHQFKSSVKEAMIFGKEITSQVILPNYEIFEDMDIIYEENSIKYYQPNALRAFVRQEAPSYLSKINLKEIEIKFKELGHRII
jgi:hypothetical protein